MLTVDFRRFPIRPGDRVLDLGSGNGRHAFEAYRRGARVLAFDLDPGELKPVSGLLEAMRTAGEAGPGAHAAAAAGDATSLPFADASFDSVIAAEILEHVLDDQRAMNELTRVLRPGGVVAVTVPAWLPERICWALSDEYHEVPGGHVRIYTQPELEAKLRRAGLSIAAGITPTVCTPPTGGSNAPSASTTTPTRSPRLPPRPRLGHHEAPRRHPPRRTRTQPPDRQEPRHLRHQRQDQQQKAQEHPERFRGGSPPDRASCHTSGHCFLARLFLARQQHARPPSASPARRALMTHRDALPGSTAPAARATNQEIKVTDRSVINHAGPNHAGLNHGVLNRGVLSRAAGNHAVPAVPGVLTADDILATAQSIARAQEPSGAIGWPDGHIDPWDHIECAMALSACGLTGPARRAYLWLRDTQRADGSWPRATVGASVTDTAAESNHAAYVATGIWHEFLVTGDNAFATAMWPTVRRAIDWVLALQAPRGRSPGNATQPARPPAMPSSPAAPAFITACAAPWRSRSG